MTLYWYCKYYLHTMYQMPHFTEHDRRKVIEFMQQYPFATITGCQAEKCEATQVPLLLSETETGIKITGHIMRDTEHYSAFEQNENVLLLFTGPNCYVSASWYSERGQGSTWNYMTVQVRGKIRLLNEQDTIHILSELTHKYESPQDRPELLEQLPKAYVQTLVKYISGFEIDVLSIHPTFKLSQNRDDQSYRHIVKQLEMQQEHGALEIALQMKKRRPELFS